MNFPIFLLERSKLKISNMCFISAASFLLKFSDADATTIGSVFLMEWAHGHS